MSLFELDLARRLEQVARGILGRRHVVVVAPHHECARPLEQRAERVEHGRHGLEVGQVVAGVDHEVGLETGERPYPVALALLVGREVQVGDVQHPQRPRTGREHRHGDPAQPVGTHLIAACVDEAGCGGRECGDGDGDGALHGSMLADAARNSLSTNVRGTRFPLGD